MCFEVLLKEYSSKLVFSELERTFFKDIDRLLRTSYLRDNGRYRNFKIVFPY